MTVKTISELYIPQCACVAGIFSCFDSDNDVLIWVCTLCGKYRGIGGGGTRCVREEHIWIAARSGGSEH